MQEKRTLPLRQICYIGIFAAVITICAWISVPLPWGVQFTMQTWAVALAGVVLGPKHGALAVLIYILLGVAGVPVFSHFRGGIGVVLGATGGFILTFPAMAWLAGLGARRGNAVLGACLLAAVAVNLIGGMVWFAVATNNTLWAAFIGAVAPFILPEIFKMIAVIIVGRGIQTAIRKAT